MAESGFDMFSDGPELNELLRTTKNFGLTLAVVDSIEDPEKLNRVRCKLVVDDSDDDIKVTDWCPVLAPLSGAACGVLWMPKKDDLVLLAFLNGDPQCPYVVGGTWNADSAAPYTVEEGKNLHYCIKTPGGSELLFYEEEEKHRIELHTPTGAILSISDEKKEATLQDGESKNSITLNWENGAVTVVSEKEMSFTCGKSKLSMDKDGAVALEGDKISIKGTDVTLEGSNAFKASGNTADVEAQTSLNLKGTNTALKGSAGVNIN